MNSIKKLTLYCDKNHIPFPEFKYIKMSIYRVECYEDNPVWYSASCEFKGTKYETKCYTPTSLRQSLSHKILQSLDVVPKEKTMKQNNTKAHVATVQNVPKRVSHIRIRNFLNMFPNDKQYSIYSLQINHSKEGYDFIPFMLGIVCNVKTDLNYAFPLYHRGYMECRCYTTELTENEYEEIKWISYKILTYKFSKNSLRFYPDKQEDLVQDEGIKYIYPNFDKITENIDKKSYKNYFIVPIDKDTLKIDFNYILNIKEKIKIYNDRCLYDVMKEEPDLNITNFIVTRTYTSDYNKFRVLGVRNDLTPLSPYPDSNYSSFSDFCVNKYKRTINDMEQPLIEATYCPNIKSRVKILTTAPPPDYVDNDKKPKTSTFVTELLNIVDPTSDLMNLCFKMPTLLTMFEWSMRFKWFTRLLEEKLNTKFSQKCIDELEIAITPSEFNPIDNYELYETLGDSLLEIFSTVVLFFKKTNINEGQLTYNRNFYTSNSMFNNLCQKWCFDDIIKQSLVPQKLILPGFNGEENYDIGKKTLADIFESIIFVIYKYNDMEKAIDFFINIMFPDFKYSRSILISWIITTVKDNEIIQKYNLQPNINNNRIITYTLPNNLEYLEYIINYQFHDKQLLVKSFTPKAILTREKIIEQSYERLEFLGDSILDWILLDYTYSLYNNKLNPVIRSELSCNDTLCYIFVSLGFYKLCYNSILESKRVEIDEYIQKLNKNEIFYGNGSEFKEISYLCPTKHYNESITQEKYGSGVKYVRMCADMFEAIVGALFIDGGLETAKTVVFKLLKPFLDRHLNLDHIMKHPVMAQKLYKSVSFNNNQENGCWYCELKLNGEKIAKCRGETTNVATLAVARKGIEYLTNLEK